MFRELKTSALLFGTFDLLHPGHIAVLTQAARYGQLTVVVTPDAKATKEKRAPHFSEKERLAMVAALKPVHKAVLGDKGAKWTVIQRLKPDVICVGHDQNADHPAFLAQLKTLAKKPRIVRLKPVHATRYSSTKIKLEIHRAHAKKGQP